jgi:hypothetical protein
MDSELRKLYTRRLNLRLGLQFISFATVLLLVIIGYALVEYISYPWISGECRLTSSLPMGNIWYTEWVVVDTTITFATSSHYNYSVGFEQMCYYNPNLGDIPSLSSTSPKKEGYWTTLCIGLGVIGFLALLAARWLYFYTLTGRRIKSIEMTQDALETVFT